MATNSFTSPVPVPAGTGTCNAVVHDLDGSPAPRPDPEVVARAKRRRFTAEYKRRILAQADAAKEPGAIGALLRREGLYSSLLATWRREREAGIEAALAPQKRGPKAMGADEAALSEQYRQLKRDYDRLAERLRKAEIVIDVQKKVAALLAGTIPAETGLL